MQLAGKGKELVSDKLWQIIEPLLAPGPQKRVEDLVFTSKTGSPMSWNNLVGRNLKPLMRAANLPEGTRPYDLRHAFCSYARTG